MNFFDAIQEPGSQFGGRHHAGFPFAEPAIPVFCHPVVDTVPDEFRDDDQRVSQGPEAVQPPRNPQADIRMGVEPVVLIKHYGIHGMRRQTGGCGQFLAEIRLKGSKPEDRFFISFDDKLYEPVAQVAHAVKEKNGMILV